MRRHVWIPSLALVATAALVGARTAATPALPAAPSAEGVTYAIDAGHSGVLFRIGHLGVSYFYGRFNQVQGTFVLDREDASKCSVTVEIDAASVDTASENRDKHIESPDFFNATEFPTISFDSTKVEAQGEKAYRVTGELDFRGVTKEVTVEMDFVGAAETRMGNRAGFEGRFTIDRKDFGVTTYPGALSDDVTLILFIEGVQQ